MEDAEILISGGGLAGLAAAAAFVAAGRDVMLVDPAPPPQAGASDLRSTAYLRPAHRLLETAGVWDALAPHATPLEGLRVIDTRGEPPAIRTRREFRSADLGEEAFGWNVPNVLARRALAAVLEDRARLRFGAGLADLLLRDGDVRARLNDGTQVRARLVVAADGRASPARALAGIGVRTRRYGQKALAFAVSHPEPHRRVSTELYAPGGAFVLVPLPDRDGRAASACVWMADGRRAVDLAALDPDAFAAAATTRSCGVQGPLTLLEGPAIWPVITQEAEVLTARRLALVAEAAHVLPPIGAQGLNTSLMDIAALLVVSEGAADPGAPEVLAHYAAARQRDVHARTAVIDLYNRVCRSGTPPVEALRSLGLALVHDLPPLRRAVMRAGLGEA